MSRREVVSPRESAQSGFTLLECEVALLLLMLLALGMARLTIDHGRIVNSVEGWLEKVEETEDVWVDPLYYVDQSDDSWARILGSPATLALTAPTLPGPPPGPDAFDVTITSVDLTLYPPTVTALVSLEEQ